MSRTYTSIDEIKQANEDAGQCWFSPDTMRFFRTRLSHKLYGGKFFVTSEESPSGIRLYSVRRANDDGSVSTVSDFHSLTSRDAHALAAMCGREPTSEVASA
jgi:hypothetical protein